LVLISDHLDLFRISDFELRICSFFGICETHSFSIMFWSAVGCGSAAGTPTRQRALLRQVPATTGDAGEKKPQ
jgi:hypothetical protein